MPKDGWNGWKDNDKDGVLLPIGNYIWKASATFVDGTIWRGMLNEDGNYYTSGVVTLIR